MGKLGAITITDREQYIVLLVNISQNRKQTSTMELLAKCSVWLLARCYSFLLAVSWFKFHHRCTTGYLSNIPRLFEPDSCKHNSIQEDKQKYLTHLEVEFSC